MKVYQPVITLRYYQGGSYDDRKKTVNRVFKNEEDASKAAKEEGKKWSKHYHDVDFIDSDVNELDVE